MTIEKNLRILSEIFQLFLDSRLPADIILKQYLVKHRFIGSKERKLITELFYNHVQNKIFIEFLAEKLNGNGFNTTEGQIIINSIISEFDIPIVSKIKPFRFYSKSMYQKTSIFFDISKVFRDITKSCQIKSTISEIKTIIEVLNNDIEKPKMDIQDRIKALSTKFSFDYELLLYIYNNVYRDFDRLYQFILASYHNANVFLRVNNPEKNISKVINELNHNDIPHHVSKLVPSAVALEKRINLQTYRFYKQGIAEIQDEGSQIVACALNPTPGSTILDACAGAGGKTLHLADLTSGKATITSCDVSARKLHELRKRADRNSFRHIYTHVIKPNEQDSWLEEKNFDYVLVDAPCSGFGTLRRNPEKKYTISMNDLKEYSKNQLQILNYYAQRTASKGFVLYATCSTLPIENEEVLARFLENNPDFEPYPLKENLQNFGINLKLSDNDHFITLSPEIQKTDGFFMALMRRK